MNYGSSLIGLDMKKRRKVRSNRYKSKHSRWLFFSILALIVLGLIVQGIR